MKIDYQINYIQMIIKAWKVVPESREHHVGDFKRCQRSQWDLHRLYREPRGTPLIPVKTVDGRL